MRRLLAWWLRCLADQIDHAGAFKATHLFFTFERGQGVVINEEGQGCQLWYAGDADYERAHTEAGAPL